MDPIIFQRSLASNHINDRNDELRQHERYLHNYPAFLTHNFRTLDFLETSVPSLPPKYKKRALPDVSTDSFIKEIFANDQTLANFTDYVYNYINYGIMTNLNEQLARDNQEILDMNHEQVFLIFKGGNIMHIYYRFFNDIIANIINSNQDNQGLLEILGKYDSDGNKYFKISDCDFNLYIITKESVRYNLLFSYAVPIVITHLHLWTFKTPILN